LRRFWIVLLASALASAACKIEQTPPRYFDHLDTTADDVRASRQELEARLTAAGQALERGSSAGLLAALSPYAEVHVFSPAHAQELTVPSEIAAALIALTDEGVVASGEPVVEVDSRNGVAWFRTSYLLPPAGERPARTLRFSGVFLRRDGEWRLVQAHVSEPLRAPLPPAPAPVGTPAAPG
jgi:hypothetical protein